jgi:type IV pilus assembly protein PilW
MSSKRRRGFTLLEVLVGLSISLIVIGMVTAIFLGQQRTFQSLDVNRVASEAARDAFLEIEPALRRAGFGLDPRHAFDFTNYACPARPCRDSATGPDTIVFYARNPTYQLVGAGGTNPDGTSCTTVGGCTYGNAFHVVATGSNTATVTLPAGTVLHKGRIVQFMCPNAKNSTMGTVATTVSGEGDQAIPLVAMVVADPTKQNDFNQNACFSGVNSGVVMFLVDRYHYLVENYGGTPWLVLDQGLDLDGDGVLPENGADRDDYLPLAQGVEDVQFAYVLNVNAPAVAGGGTAAAPGPGPDFPSPAGGPNQGNWVVGDFPGQVEEPDPSVTKMPLYATSIADPLRFNNSSANIRGVRVSLSLRSLLTDQSKPSSWSGDVERQMENRSTATLLSGGRFRRFSFQTVVNTRDMESRNSFLF